MVTALERYKKRLEQYYAAEEAILSGAQSYKVGSRSLTRANLNEIADMIKYLENSEFTGIYNVSKLSGLDSYDVYLDGASSFIEIFNSNSTGGELVVFRDSFGSSLVPLLIPYYSKITVIDNRYISSEYFNKLITNYDADVLFLYSTLIVNDSGSLKN